MSVKGNQHVKDLLAAPRSRNRLSSIEILSLESTSDFRIVLGPQSKYHAKSQWTKLRYHQRHVV